MLQMSFHRYLLYNNELYGGERSVGNFIVFMGFGYYYCYLEYSKEH